ncbi:MAG: fumarylacetoacetate hydrolase family protein, partial [Rubrivivax sp.]|nr:fumarylacetoacetate hydrolase family protein [Rubrivivax sp.]
MRIATYLHQGHRHVGRVDAGGSAVTPFLLDEAVALRGALPLVEAAAAGQPLPALAPEPLPLAAVRLEAPLPRPRRNLWCVGRNYHAHASELRDTVFKDSPKATDQWPIVFTKVPECVIGPDDTVRLPGEAVSAQIDYEAELAVVIGRGGRNIARAQALEHVFGWT